MKSLDGAENSEWPVLVQPKPVVPPIRRSWSHPCAERHECNASEAEWSEAGIRKEPEQVSNRSTPKLWFGRTQNIAEADNTNPPTHA